MQILDYIFFLFVEPLKLLFEVIFFYAYKLTENAGLSIVMISLAINFLLLPLYLRADRLEKEQKNKKEALQHGIDHIKSTFRGDEKVMMLQTYYHQNDYKTTDVFKESVSLFLQILFFMAAYNFLAGLSILQGVSLGPIPDLGAPDRLITIGAISINLLPVLMTLINIVSSFIYSGKGNIKDNLKLIIIALVFLVLLYNSPSGLVFYWTLNNIFSLCKNVVMHIKKPKEAGGNEIVSSGKGSKTGYVIISGAILAVLTGIMIPSGVIAQNPEELANLFLQTPHTPSTYVLSSALIAFGIFVIWIPLFIYLTGLMNRKMTECIYAGLAVTGLINWIIFNKNFGLLSCTLIYEEQMQFTAGELMKNTLIDLIVIGIVTFAMYKNRSLINKAIVTILLSEIVISCTNLGFTMIKNRGVDFANVAPENDPSISLTTTGQNVIVIMMDRLISGYIPYIFDEYPEVAQQFDGFTYYPNTISFGCHTNFGSPALYGGYEYTPYNINARTDETLADKQNEALSVMPQLFAQEGWNVSVSDPSYAGYHWIPDLHIYDYNENIKAYNLSVSMCRNNPVLIRLGDEYETELNRNFFCYGLMKILPYFLQPVAYSDGSYNFMNIDTELYAEFDEYPLVFNNNNRNGFIRAYNELSNIGTVLDITDDPQNCFFMFANGMSHAICLLYEPKYDNPIILNGTPMYLDDRDDFAHYESDTEACRMLGRFFDYLRANNVYDNTRIIIVADHGYNLANFDDLLITDFNLDAEWVNPVLMVKDFNASGLTTSFDFMTNADTPALAVRGIIDDPVNPFTGNPLNAVHTQEDMLIYTSHKFNIFTNNGNRFDDDPYGQWVTVHDNIFDSGNWNLYDGA